MTTSRAILQAGAQRLGAPLSEAQTAQLLLLGDELVLWNKDYNLTAVDDPAKVLTIHLLDSLSVHQDLAGERIADVGTGAGFPGLPLAILNPQRAFTLIDATAKKLRFVTHVATLLGLHNVVTRHARVEAMSAEPAFDTVLTRAFAPLPRLLGWVGAVCDAHTRVIAMKGRWPPEPGMDDAGELPRGWRIESVRHVEVPGLDAQRHVLQLRRAARPS